MSNVFLFVDKQGYYVVVAQVRAIVLLVHPMSTVRGPYPLHSTLLDNLPKARWLLADQSYAADWFRDALEEKGIKLCILGRESPRTPIKYDKRRYKRRNHIEIMFSRLKDWRHVATRYDRCPTVFFSAIRLAATDLAMRPESKKTTSRKRNSLISSLRREFKRLFQKLSVGDPTRVFLDPMLTACMAASLHYSNIPGAHTQTSGALSLSRELLK